MKRQLLVESIRIDGQTQSRERINDETVEEYAEVLEHHGEAGKAMPAVTVFFDGTEYWLADGFHRLLAVRRIGRKNIAADVKEGSREDAAWAACAANQTHGLRRTNADKRKAVVIGLRLHPEMSDQAIANHCGVGRELAFDVRRQVVGILQPGRRTGADGKSYPVPLPAAKRASDQRVGPPPRPEDRRGQAATPPGPPPAAAVRPAAEAPRRKAGGAVPLESAGQVDDIGRRIPEHLVELWGRRQEVQDMLTALSRVRVALREAQDTCDPLFSEVPYSSALAHLDQAYDAVQVAKPYAVCAFCQGHGCKACGERGLLGKFRWDTTVPEEHKAAVARIIQGQVISGQ